MTLSLLLLFLLPLLLSFAHENPNVELSNIAYLHDDLLTTLQHRLSQPSPLPPYHAERISYDERLTPLEFRDRYAKRSIPVVIGSRSDNDQPPQHFWSKTEWNSTYFKNNCDVPARIRIGTQETPLWEWELVYVKLRTYIEFIEGQREFITVQVESSIEGSSSESSSSGSGEEQREIYQPDNTYLFDFPLSLCPAAVLDDFLMPRWFANDLLTLCYFGEEDDVTRCPYNQGEWPSLFIGAPSFQKSPLHRDTFGSSFFSIQLAGTKTWRMYPAEDSALLCPINACCKYLITDVLGRDNNLSSSSSSPVCPLLEHARYVDVVVNPGEILYVPSGSPHQVLSSDLEGGMTIMIGMNLVQEVDVEKVLEATRPKVLRESSNGEDGEEQRFYTSAKYTQLYRFFSKHRDDFSTWTEEWESASGGDHVPFREFERRLKLLQQRKEEL